MAIKKTTSTEKNPQEETVKKPAKRKPRRPGPKKKRGVKPRMSKKVVLEKLRKYYEFWLSTTRSCRAYNSAETDLAISEERTPFLIAERTVHAWEKKDLEFAKTIESFRDSISVNARTNWAKQIKEWDYQASKEWLERQERTEFSTRSEITGKDGALIFESITVKISNE